MRMAPIIVVAGALAALAVSASSAHADGWVRPVDGALLRAFSVGPDRFAAGQHRGIDLGAPPGGRVLAACGGRVTFAGWVPRGGRTVSVRCGALISTVQHLRRVGVRRGQIVLPGGPIGTAGDVRPRPHVHLSARVAATGAYRDPLALLADGPAALPGPLPTLRRVPPSGAPPRAQPRFAPPGPAPAPAARRAPVPLELPLARPLAAAPRAPAAERLPWPVWLGVALVALGLPLGGGLVLARRRRGAAVRVGSLARAAQAQR